MKITEVIGSFADQHHENIAPVSDWMHRIANQFTQSGQVKRPLDFHRLDQQSATALPPFSSMPMSREDLPAATSNLATNSAPPLNGPTVDYGADYPLRRERRVGASPFTVDQR
jgi:hypothetical protein